MRLALKNQVKVERLILSGSVGFTHKIPASQIPITITPVANLLAKIALPLTTKHLGAFLKSSVYRKDAIEDIFVNYLTESVLRSKESHPLKCLNSMTKFGRMKPEFDLSKQVKNISVPVLCIWGQQDSLVPYGLSKSSVSELKQGRTAIIANTGHLPFIEDPEAFLSNTHLLT